MNEPTPLPLDVRGLGKAFRGRPRVDDVTFSARPGRITGLLGPHCAGNTTTIRLLLGLVGPDAGDALVFGVTTDRVKAVLAEVGMSREADRRAGSYSLGMRQRIAIAAALLDEPRLLVLDEPSNGLDPAGMHWLRQKLRGFAAAGGTVLISSHLLSNIQEIADDVVVVTDGRVVTETPMDAVLADPSGTLEGYYLEVTGTERMVH